MRPAGSTDEKLHWVKRGVLSPTGANRGERVNYRAVTCR